MESRVVDTGERELPLLTVVDSWARHVLRLAEESKGVETRDSWVSHDYVGALYVRDEIERGLSGEINPTVAAIDELLRGFTRPDEFGELRILGYEVPSEPWWWQRVPSTGPIADELHALRMRTG